MTETATPSLDERYPEHAKLTKIKAQSNTIYMFLQWAAEEKNYLFGQNLLERTTAFEGVEVPVVFREASERALEDLLAEHFGIDAEKLRLEKERMYDDLCAASAPQEG
ncbi:hypothetical protein ACWD7M_16385 [Streptomyces griseus]